MSLLTTLQDEMKIAMKARDQVRLDALRLLVSAIKYALVDNSQLDDAGAQQVLSKEAKKRREAIEAYKAAGRSQQAAHEEFELKLIEEYLPKMIGEDEVRAIVQKTLDSSKPENFGMAMNAAMKAIGKGAEGGIVAKIVKELFK